MLGKNAPANHSRHHNTTPEFTNILATTQPHTAQYTLVVPVPHDAPQFEKKHAGYFNKQFCCEPSDIYTYTDMFGEVIGHMVRWDFLQNGEPHKEMRPFQYCRSQSGNMDWGSCGFSKPRPLYCLDKICSNPDTPVLICEGEKTAAAAKILFPSYIITTSMHGARSVKETDWSPLHGRSVILALDHDNAGKNYGDDVYGELKDTTKSIQLLRNEIFSQYSIDEDESVIEHQRDLPKGWDLADALDEGWTAELIQELFNLLDEDLFTDYPAPIAAYPLTEMQYPIGSYSMNIKDFLEWKIPLRNLILSPIIPEQGLVMLYAPRGIGKTYVSLTIAYTVAAGSKMFNDKWSCENPCKVLFVDGEMPASVLQERLANMVSNSELELTPDNLQIITPDRLPLGMCIPDLSTNEGQQFIEKHLDGVKLLILDNLSALCRTGKENDSESWIPMQGWLLSLRKREIAVLLIHHSNKNGGQRGTSKKEDLLDTVIELKKGKNYNPEDGARFEVHYTKARGFFGDDAKPFEAWLAEENRKTYWKVTEIEDSQLEEAMALSAAGMTQRDIAKEMDISPATVCRLLKKGKI